MLALAVAGEAVTMGQTDNSTAAEALFREGKRLVERQDFAQACPKLAESYRLDPATGALLALAVCHEGAGKLASAWAEYAQVAARAKAEGRSDREQAAREKVAALEPKLAVLTISVSSAADVAELRVHRDGEEVARAAWGLGVPVDAGEHTIDASAPGRKPWRLTVSIAAEIERRRVEVPPLEAAATTLAATVKPSPLATATNAAAMEAAQSRAAPLTPTVQGVQTRAETHRHFTPLQKAGLATAGAGALALGVAGIFGLQALSKKHDYESKPVDCQFDCPDLRAANSKGDIATAFTVGGLLLVAGGATMYFLRPTSGHGQVALSIAPVLAASEWRLGVEGRF